MFKFLVFVTLLAVALALPAEESTRNRRTAYIGGYPAGYARSYDIGYAGLGYAAAPYYSGSYLGGYSGYNGYNGYSGYSGYPNYGYNLGYRSGYHGW